MRRRARTPNERLWPKIERTETCWLWRASLDGKGYGKFWFNGRLYQAHVLLYMLFKGPIPAGLVLDHLCRVRACVNPDHLEPVTMRINLLRGVGFVAIQAQRTHCPQGHPLGTYIEVTKTGTRKRHCKVCRSAVDARRRADGYFADYRARKRRERIGAP